MKIAGTDLNLLVAFDALLSEGSVSAAASKIGLSQPAMSKRLSRLRALFQDDLFVRTGDGVKPTERALDLADPIRAARDRGSAGRIRQIPRKCFSTDIPYRDDRSYCGNPYAAGNRDAARAGSAHLHHSSRDAPPRAGRCSGARRGRSGDHDPAGRSNHA